LAASPVAEVNSTSNDGTPFLSGDGLALYFFSTRPGGLGNRDIWVALRSTAQSSFLSPTLLGVVNSPELDHLPSLSRDGLTLYVSSRRAGGPGALDIFVATRALPSGSFSTPAPISGDAVNSSADDEGAAESEDGLTLYFASTRGGNFDIWTARRTDRTRPFSSATPLQVVNSPAIDENAFLSADGVELLFSSGRDGTQRLWRSMRQCP
jgi:Tol biopolymer transport system component